MTKEASFLQEGFFRQQTGLNSRMKLVKLLHLEHSFVRRGAWGGAVVKALRY